MISKINFTGNTSKALNKAQKNTKNANLFSTVFGKKATTVGLKNYEDTPPYFSVIA